MKHLKYLRRYQKMQKLILNERTGSAEEFAFRLGLSRRMLFEYLDDMRDMGMDIRYSRRRRTYYTRSDGFDLMI